MTTTKNRFLYLAAATALGLTLASCSGDGGTEETDGPAGGDATTSEQTDDTASGGDATEDEATEDEATEDEATEDDGGDVAASGGAECLVGTWAMTPEAMEEQVLAQLGGEGEVSVEGTSSMTFDGTTVTSEANNTSTYSAEVQGTAVEGATTTDGTIVVNYTADDATLTYADIVSADGTISITAAGSTQEQDIAETAALMTGQTQDFTCTDTELTLSTDMSGTEFSQTFTRA